MGRERESGQQVKDLDGEDCGCMKEKFEDDLGLEQLVQPGSSAQRLLSQACSKVVLSLLQTELCWSRCVQMFEVLVALPEHFKHLDNHSLS